MFQVIYWLNLSYEYVENVGMTLLVCLAVPRGYISWSHYRSVCTCCVLRQGNTLSDVYRERKWMLYGFPKSRGICDLWGLEKRRRWGEWVKFPCDRRIYSVIVPCHWIPTRVLLKDVLFLETRMTGARVVVSGWQTTWRNAKGPIYSAIERSIFTGPTTMDCNKAFLGTNKGKMSNTAQ